MNWFAVALMCINSVLAAHLARCNYDKDRTLRFTVDIVLSAGWLFLAIWRAVTP